MRSLSQPRRTFKRSFDEPPPALAALGKLALDRRLQLELTQTALAARAGVGVSSVYAIEAGRDSMTLTVAIRILEALDLAVTVGPARRNARPDAVRLNASRPPSRA